MSKDINRRKIPRVEKDILACLPNNQNVLVKNISKQGGFLKTNHNNTNNQEFSVSLQLNKYKSVVLNCIPKWSNNVGVGFHVNSVEDGKHDLYCNFVEKQLSDIEKFGQERVFQTDIFIGLEHTNSMGQDVYFSNYFRYQGMCRERMLLHHIPDMSLFTESGIGLVTIEAYNKYINHAYFGEAIVGEVTTKDIMASRASLIIRFKNKETGKLIGEGFQTFCCVNKKRRVIRMPKIFDFLEFYQEVV